MRRLMLDHFRRWSRVLALCAVFALMQGWFIASSAEYAFEFWIFLLALWTGANLLSFDLRRGVVRAIAVLPLTARQIGRGWWLATVGIPAIALAALLFLGAAAFYAFHPDMILPMDRLAMASLFILLWLGILFTTIFPTPGFFGKGRERVLTGLFAALSFMMLFGGMVFFQDTSKNPIKFGILLGVGALLTVVGWLRAERFVLGRASFRLAALQSQNPRGRHRAPGGYGGIPFLLSTTCIRAFLYLAAMAALMVLCDCWNGQRTSPPANIEFFAPMGSFMSCWFIIFFQLMTVLRQLRSLRTLPISATRLAAVMIALAILPLMALGALGAGAAWLAWGTPVARLVLTSYTFILGAAALCVFFAVWQGTGTQISVLMVLTMFAFQQLTLWLPRLFHYPKIPFMLTGPIVACCVLLAFLLTRRSLLHSNHAYRAQANSFGSVPWGMGG